MSPRLRLLGIALNLAAAGLLVASVPLAILFEASRRGVDAYQVLNIPGSSLIVTLWIFAGVAFGALANYSAFLVMWKRSEGGGTWLVFGMFATAISSVFVGIIRLDGALFGLAAGALLITAGLLDFLDILRVRLRLKLGLKAP